MPHDDLKQICPALDTGSDVPPVSHGVTASDSVSPSGLDSRDQQTRLAEAIEGYTMIREVARGGQGAVFECVRKTTGRRVAVKVLTGGAFITPLKKARFEREVQILAGLDQPNIVGIIDRGSTSDGSLFLVMDFIDGQPLDQFLNTYYQKHPEGPPPTDPSELLRLFIKICEAVNAAHLKGVVHRDLKPPNIRVTESREPYILDFGLARSALTTLDSGAEGASMTGEFMGTIAYASPEQAEGHNSKIDSRTDVYSLGVILYQMMTRRFPYEVSGTVRDVLNNIVRSEPVPPSRLFSTDSRKTHFRKIRRLHLKDRGAINSTLESIILKALSKERAKRYQQAGDLGKDIANYLSGRATVAGSEQLFRRGKTPSRHIAAVASVVIAAGLCGGIWRMTHSGPRHDSNDQKFPLKDFSDASKLLTQLEHFALVSKQLNPQGPLVFSAAENAILANTSEHGDLKDRIRASILLSSAKTDALLAEADKPSDVETAMLNGKRWYFDKASEYDKAIPFFKQAMDLQPKSVEARQFLAESLIFARLGKSASRQKSAIEICDGTLKLVEPNSPDWARTNNDLGNAWFNLPAINRSANLQHAIDAYTAASIVYTEDADPIHWALIQTNVARVWLYQYGDRVKNLQTAIADCRKALKIRTRTADPIGWAVTQNILGIAIAQLPDDSSKNVQTAIDVFNSALEIRSLESDPYGWAETQNNLGNALFALPADDPTQNLNRAIRAFMAALKVYTRIADPSNWAMTQIDLGNAWFALAKGDRSENLQNAIWEYEAALEVISNETDPFRWAAAQNNLGFALTDPVLPAGERWKNRARAISALQSALTVFTKESYADQWAMTHGRLQSVLTDATQPDDAIRAK